MLVGNAVNRRAKTAWTTHIHYKVNNENYTHEKKQQQHEM